LTEVAGLTAREAERLGDITLLRGLSPPALRCLLAGTRVSTVGAGTTLFIQDEPADRFYILLDGWVKLYRISEEGAQAIVTVVIPGETFAEAAIFASARFPVCAETVSDARLLTLSREGLSRSLAADPEIAFAMLGSLSMRLRHMVGTIEHLQVKSAPQRLGDFLLRLCPPDAATASVTLPFPKALVAQRLAMRPETLSRALNKLRAVGISAAGDMVRIENIPDLRAYCEREDRALP
jgi:CRP-like cAMP-binding protein